MSEQRNLVIVRPCLVFSLAIALAAIGMVIFFDYLFREGSVNGRIALPPGGGLASLLVSASLLALLFRRSKAATALALAAIAVALGQAALPYIPMADALGMFAISLPLLLVILLTEITVIAAIHLGNGRLVGRINGPLVIATGLLSLLSYWLPSLQAFSLGTMTEATMIVIPLVTLIGLVLLFLHTIHSREIPNFSPGLVLAGVLGITLTTSLWHNMRIQNSNNLQATAEVLADHLAAAGLAALNDDLALIRRLAHRQQFLTSLSDEKRWTQEVQSYLNDFQHIRLIASLNPERVPLGVHSRADQYREWLARFLEPTANNTWLDHVAETGQPHLSRPVQDAYGQMFAMIASPVNAVAGKPWHIVAIIDLPHIYSSLLQHYNSGLSARIYYENRLILGYSPTETGSQTIPLFTRYIESHHDSRWKIEIYNQGGALAGSALYLPPLVLFTGLILSFLVMLSHLFWRESERRSDRLQTLNKSVSAHLVCEQSLRHTNERIMEFSRDILCSIDAQGIFLSINPASEDILGYRPDQLIGELYAVLIAPEDREATAEELRKLVAGERPLTAGFRNHLRHRDGHIVTLSWTAEWSEKDQALFCAGRDMTDQLAAETLMREREQFFSLSPDMFCIVDLNSHFFELNQAFEDVLGYQRDELLGTSYRQLIHEEDRSRIEEAITAMIAGNNITALPVRAIAKDNTEHWLELSATLSSDELIYVAARDTTDMRRTQEQVRRYADQQSRIFESITDAFFTLNREWRFTYVNRRSAELMGESQEDLLENTLWEAFPAAINSEFDRQYRHAMETGESVSFEAYYEPRDDWFEVSAYPSDEGLAVYYRSINERRLAQQTLEQTMAELERSNRELQDFAFVASHDLQEPLRKIQAFSDRLLTRSDRFNEQEQDYLQRMQSAAGRMQSLIQDLLTYSRVTTRAKPLTVCDTNRILGEVLQDMETVISRENAIIDTSPLPTIIGDATQIRQVLQNLLSNAIKFHKVDQNPQVLIRAENITVDGWTLVVSDTGVGFDERYAEKLFHPFQRLHQQAFPGTGIGMAIVKKILDRHGATVMIESKIDQGTTFRIHFPTSHDYRTDSND